MPLIFWSHLLGFRICSVFYTHTFPATGNQSVPIGWHSPDSAALTWSSALAGKALSFWGRYTASLTSVILFSWTAWDYLSPVLWYPALCKSVSVQTVLCPEKLCTFVYRFRTEDGWALDRQINLTISLESPIWHKLKREWWLVVQSVPPRIVIRVSCDCRYTQINQITTTETRQIRNQKLLNRAE